MKRISTILFACSIGLAVHAQSIDLNTSNYTLSRVNDGNTEANISFLNNSGSLQAAYTTPDANNTYEQVLFLRGDYTLGVGQMLVADVLGTPAGWDRDLGIAVGYTATPPSLAAGASGDVRSSYVEVSVRSNNQVVSYARDGSSSLTSGQEFAGTTYNGDSFTAYPTSLFISRVATKEFEVGWMQGSTVHVLTANGGDLGGSGIPYYTINTDTPGAAVGFYADIRTAIASSPPMMSNFRIQAIPEPTSFAFFGLSGLLGLVGWMRRRIA